MKNKKAAYTSNAEVYKDLQKISLISIAREIVAFLLGATIGFSIGYGFSVLAVEMSATVEENPCNKCISKCSLK